MYRGYRMPTLISRSAWKYWLGSTALTIPSQDGKLITDHHVLDFAPRSVFTILLELWKVHNLQLEDLWRIATCGGGRRVVIVGHFRTGFALTTRIGVFAVSKQGGYVSMLVNSMMVCSSTAHELQVLVIKYLIYGLETRSIYNSSRPRQVLDISSASFSSFSDQQLPSQQSCCSPLFLPRSPSS